jgi:hypothetical protein
VGFQLLLDQLRDIVRDRVKNGQMTERNLARLTSTSQPHLHNVLKGIRALTPDLADRLLAPLDISIQDLVPGYRAAHNAQSPLPPDAVSALLPLRDIPHPAVTRLGPDSRMFPRFQSGDLAFFDESPAARRELDSRAAYLVNYHDTLLVRYIRWGGKRLYLVAEDSLTDPLRWDFALITGGNILEIVRGRIVWICRQLET